ncbi:unnamed protein product [Phaedon cochleariae]|uniref:Endonuclease-reverse transcriptase n=1 Tax=Phaedon cochleariae TaxID=80249 RepID=A0A9P0DMW9_PHACE|nr:unnamed protein product [Phaedon cochleariae]
MGGKEITLKDVYLLMQNINTNLSEKIEKVEQSTQSLCKALQIGVSIVKEEVQILQEENKQLKSKLEKVEKRQKHNNLVFYGIKEEASENQHSLLETIVEITEQKLEIELKKSDFNDIFRLGKKSGSQSGHNRPILVSLISHIKRQEILRSGKKFKSTGIFVADDLSDSERKERKILIEGLKEARNNNKKASIKGNKLIIEGKEYTASNIPHAEQSTSTDYFSPPSPRKSTSAPTTPSPKEIEIEEEEEEIEEENNRPASIIPVKPQADKKKEEIKLKAKTTSTSSSGETPKKLTRSNSRPFKK